MYRARIPLAAAVVIALTTIAVLLSIRFTLASGAEAETQKRVERAQATWPSLDLLRGIDLTNETAKLAREDEFGSLFEKKNVDEQRQAAFVAVSARNARLEEEGHKPDLVAVLGSNGHVVARDLNINAMYDDDLKGRYPSVGKALDGIANKDVWNFDGHLYRVGAAPIRAKSGQVAGALVIGYVASAGDAEADRDKLGAEVAIFLDGKIHASSFHKEGGGESAEEKALAQLLFDGPRLADGAVAGTLTKPTAIKIGSEDFIAAAGPLPGNLTRSKSGFVVLASLTVARANLGQVELLILVLGLIGLLVGEGAAVMTAMRFLQPLDKIETGVGEVINGNRDYTFDTPSKDFEGLANALNVMLARLLGRPDPSDDELGTSDNESQQRWGGELTVDANTTGPQTTPELAALAEEPEESYLRRVFEEYLTARKQTNEGTEGLTFEGFAQKIRQNEAALRKKYSARLVRFKVVIKNQQTTLKPYPIQ
jgi:hypothetical protein